MFEEKKFTWDRTGGDPITQGNRNPLLYKNMGVDGIKTGFLGSEKYSLASSLKRNERRVIAVASGFETKNLRSKESAKLLTYGVTNFDTIEIAKKNTVITNLDVWHGKQNSVGAYVNKDIFKTIPKARKKYLKVVVDYDGPIEAPISKDQKIGELRIFYKDDLIDQEFLLASKKVNKINVFSRLIRSINFLIWGDV